MSNLTRYDLGGYDCGQTYTACGMEVSTEGEYVKFDDIKELLNSSHNNREPKLPLDIKEAFPKLFPPTEMSLKRAYEDGAIAMYNLLERQLSAAR